MSAVPLQAVAIDTDTTRLDRLEREVRALHDQLAALTARVPEKRMAICVISGEFEKVMTALMLATMAASMEMPVTMFFAFWGVQAVTARRRFRGKALTERALTLMRQPDIAALASHKFNFGGLGPRVFTHLMRGKGIATPAELLETALELGVDLRACTTSMDVFGLREDELRPGVTTCGAAQFLAVADRSSVSLLV
ncbi:MAG: DsrE/DsrF/DrsH-like family protein [Vicinamibacterales bacterium]